MGKLQKTRKERIHDVIERYTLLIDKIFKEVSTELPKFKDRVNKEGEVLKTAEEQKYEYISLRQRALQNADTMLHSINSLELELYEPEELVKKEETKEEEDTSVNPNNKHIRTE